MPARNAGQFISQAIESLLRQDYSHWELIIIDDASSDRTYSIAKEFSLKNKQIKVFQNKKKLGIPKTRNIALHLAQGEFIGHLDADDLLAIDALSMMLKSFKNNTALVYSGYITIDSQGKEIDKNMPIPFDKDKLGFIGWQHFGMYRKKVAIEVGGFNEKLRTCSDGDLFVKIGKKYSCKRLSEYLYFYRWHKDNIGHSRPECPACSHQNHCNFYQEYLQNIKYDDVEEPAKELEGEPRQEDALLHRLLARLKHLRQ